MPSRAHPARTPLAVRRQSRNFAPSSHAEELAVFEATVPPAALDWVFPHTPTPPPRRARAFGAGSAPRAPVGPAGGCP